MDRLAFLENKLASGKPLSRAEEAELLKLRSAPKEAAPDPSIEYPLAEAPRDSISAPDPTKFEGPAPTTDPAGKAVAAAGVEAKKDEAETAAPPDARHDELPKMKDKSFGEKLGELAKKYGPRIAEIIQAGAYGQAMVDRPLAIQQRKAEELDEKAKARAEKMAAEERAWQEKILARQQEYEAAKAKSELERQKELIRYSQTFTSPTGAAGAEGLSEGFFDPAPGKSLRDIAGVQ